MRRSQSCLNLRSQLDLDPRRVGLRSFYYNRIEQTDKEVRFKNRSSTATRC
jgi:hypothetical protein